MNQTTSDGTSARSLGTPGMPPGPESRLGIGASWSRVIGYSPGGTSGTANMIAKSTRRYRQQRFELVGESLRFLESLHGYQLPALQLGTVLAVPDWILSPRSGAAYLDLSRGVSTTAADRLVGELLHYYEREQVNLVVVSVGEEPSPQVKELVSALKDQAKDHGVAFTEQRP